MNGITRYEPKPKRYYKRYFEGSRELYNYCWNKYTGYLKGAIDDPTNDADVNSWLESLASEAVNNSRTKYYVYG